MNNKQKSKQKRSRIVCRGKNENQLEKKTSWWINRMRRWKTNNKGEEGEEKEREEEKQEQEEEEQEEEEQEQE